MPLFSVIVPVYKVEAYLPECIDSLLTQTYTEFELILVDDGSPDNCGKICDEYAEKDNRVRAIHKENGGVTSARLAGAEAAVGTYIVCVDGDDWVSSDYLERFAEHIRECHPDILCCGFVEAYNDRMIEQPIWISGGFYNREKIENELFRVLIAGADGLDFPSYVCGKAIRRDLYHLQQKAVDKCIPIWEDEAVAKPCLYYADSVFILKECMYFYRKIHTSVTNAKKAFNWDFPMLVGRHYEAQIDMEKADFQAQVYRNVVTHLYVVVASQFFREESYRSVTEDIKKHLQEPYYQNALDKCKFHGSWKMHLKHFALKHRMYLFMWLHNRVWCCQREKLLGRSRKDV